MTQAKVARVGRKEYAREALPPSYWRQILRALAFWALIGLSGWLVFGLTAIAWYYA